MSTLTNIGRAVVGVIGVVALLLAGGNLVTGGGSITDPVMPGGVVLGLLAIGAAVWTTAPGRIQAAVVWLGVLGIAGAAVIMWANVGEMETRDLLVYIGIPTSVILVATALVAVSRVRAGALGAT